MASHFDGFVMASHFDGFVMASHFDGFGMAQLILMGLEWPAILMGL